jgi:hypothetical protein
MDARLAWSDERSQAQREPERGVRPEVWLLGQPPLNRYLNYVRDTTVNGRDLARSQIIEEWRQANDYYGELEVREAGVADDPEIRELDPVLAPLVRELMADNRWRRGFDTVPALVAMVELDRLIVSQLHVDLVHTETLQARLGSAPTPEALFRFCLPLDRAEAPVQVRRAGSQRFLFWSESSDFRFHDPVLLDPGQIDGHDPCGPLAGVVGLMVGYGSNFLNVVQSDGRLILSNGYHRAYALRALGVTHAPCILQTATRRDELDLIASRTVLEDPAFYLKAARPPLLKDFFDARIRKVLQVRKMLRVVELKFEVKEFEIIDFNEAA